MKKCHSIPNRSIHLLANIIFKVHWKLTQKTFLLLQIKISFYYCRLFDIICYFLFVFFWKFRFIIHLVKGFHTVYLLNIIWSYFLNNISQSVNIISQNYATKSLYKYHADCFVFVCWSKISKAYCQHYRCCPIISPNINLCKIIRLNLFFNDPILRMIQISHQYQKYG